MSPPQSKSQLVILDAVVVIEAFRNNSWQVLVDKYAVVLARKVVSESKFYKDDQGSRVEIDLSPFERNKSIKVIDVPASQLRVFLDEFGKNYVDRLHDGELESLCFLTNSAGPEALICSADSIVYKTLGKLLRSANGISLEELLIQAGCPKQLDDKFKKSTRERWGREGLSDSFMG